MIGALKIITSAILLVLLQGVDLYAAELPKGYFKRCGEVIAAKALSGDTFFAEDGQKITLADIKAPELWPKEAPYSSWPYAYTARDVLELLIKGKRLTLYCDNNAKTLTGNPRAQALLPDASWVQEHMIRAGHAFFFRKHIGKFPSDLLLKAEADARTEKAGLWRTGAYAVKPAHAPDDIRIGWFQFVEGRVVSAKKVRNKIYLNFGDDWAKDFTVEIPLSFVRRMAVDPLTLTGKSVSVRGWVEWAGGPKIILESPHNLRGPSPYLAPYKE